MWQLFRHDLVNVVSLTVTRLISKKNLMIKLRKKNEIKMKN